MKPHIHAPLTEEFCFDCQKEKLFRLESKIKELTKVIEDRGHAFQNAQNKTLLENQRLESELKSAVEFIQKIADEDYRGNRPTICSDAHNWLLQYLERSDEKEKAK